jgi:hypothetical protein
MSWEILSEFQKKKILVTYQLALSFSCHFVDVCHSAHGRQSQSHWKSGSSCLGYVHLLIKSPLPFIGTIPLVIATQCVPADVGFDQQGLTMYGQSVVHPSGR